MVNEQNESKTKEELLEENIELKARLDEAEETLNAIQNGEVDAIVTPQGSDGPRVYTLESADSLYRHLVQEMGEGVATLTTDGTIFYSNAQLASFIKVPLDKIIGQKLNNFILPEDLETYQDIFDRGFKTKSKGEIRIKTVDGIIIPVQISINSLKDLKGLYIVITDLSEHKHHEELKILHYQLKKTVDELKRSNNELQQFAYAASHDLQEPLRMITSFSQLLERRYKDRLDKDAEEFIEFILQGAQSMKHLIDDLLIYAKVTMNPKEFEQVDFENVLNVVQSNLSVSIEENNATITHDPLPNVFADDSQMIQVFQNLIGNAIKFKGKNKPKIHISVQKCENEWKFALEDNGIGIDPENQEKIFEVFNRLHTREEYPGTGVGLSICQKIVERHFGQIWAESELGKGTTFYFTIPVNG
jgi:PAS domain S-box-containing protein